MNSFRLNMFFASIETEVYRPLAERGVLLTGEREIETIFSLGNGYIGTRNSLEEGYSESDPGSFIAGLYVQAPDDDFNFLVKAPDWTVIKISVGDNLLDLKEDKPLFHSRYIDFERGLAVREWQSEDKQGRITNIRIIKYISLAHKHEMGKLVMINPVNYSGNVTVTTGIDCNAADFGYLLNMNSQVEDFASIYMKTKYTGKDFVLLQKSDFTARNEKQDRKTDYNREVSNLYSGSYENFEWNAELGQQYIIKSLCTAHSRTNSETLLKKAKGAYERHKEDCFNESIENHCKKWAERFAESRVVLSGNDYDQRLVDLATYHLITAGEFSGNTCSIPARNLSGESYKGHVFWDTEMYLLPFYTLTKPDIARNLLMYRYNTLDGARKNAVKEGFKGASYAWESTDSGLEAAPELVILPNGEVIKILSGGFENHISPDIAYSVYKYWQATLDDDFMANYGAEILFETARFCTSLLHKENDGLYHTKSSIGPDEYHECVADNTYTNYLAKNNFDIALKTYDWIESKFPEKFEKLRGKIELNTEEIQEWKEIHDNIYLAYDPKTKLYEQFKGFYELEYVDLKKYEPRSIPMDIILGRETTQNSQVIKQPDVLMFMTLFGERFSKEQLTANYEYYEERCGHGSSLSPSIHSIAAARIGNVCDAYRYFLKNAQIDVGDEFGNAAGGIHIAAQGGVWMSLVLGFAGLYTTEQGLIFDPCPHPHWEKMELPLVWRGQKLKIILIDGKINISTTGDHPINVSIGTDNWRKLAPNTKNTAVKINENWKWRE